MNKLDNVNATITVALEEKDYQDKVKKTLKEINQNRPEPGFRPRSEERRVGKEC